MEVIIKIGDKYYAGNVEGGSPSVPRGGWGIHVSKPYSSLPTFTKDINQAKSLGSSIDLVREFEKIIQAIRLKWIDVDFKKIEIINLED